MAAEPKIEPDTGESGSLGPANDGEDTSLEPEEDPEAFPDTPITQDQPPPKRKGGRKPIYATVEERKQRNRQAQAAFRERRSEYIKQLEDTLKQHEELLQVAQRERQTAAYHSSSMQRRITTLERILHENGIDVETELQARGEQLALPQDPPVLPGSFQVPSVPGIRRSLKQAGTSGNTKLDLLKSKAASARNSLASPLNSPQSQASLWSETSPSSPMVASPTAVQYASHTGNMYQPAGTAYPQEMHGVSRQAHGMDPTHGHHNGFGNIPQPQSQHHHARELPLPMDNCGTMQPSMDWHARFPEEWHESSIHSDLSRTSRSSANSRIDHPHQLPHQAHGLPNANTSAMSPATRARNKLFGNDDLTMPEGFSQEIFPLTYSSSSMQFPASSGMHGRRGTNSSS